MLQDSQNKTNQQEIPDEQDIIYLDNVISLQLQKNIVANNDYGQVTLTDTDHWVDFFVQLYSECQEQDSSANDIELYLKSLPYDQFMDTVIPYIGNNHKGEGVRELISAFAITVNAALANKGIIYANAHEACWPDDDNDGMFLKSLYLLYQLFTPIAMNVLFAPILFYVYNIHSENLDQKIEELLQDFRKVEIPTNDSELIEFQRFPFVSEKIYENQSIYDTLMGISAMNPCGYAILDDFSHLLTLNEINFAFPPLLLRMFANYYDFYGGSYTIMHNELKSIELINERIK